MRDKKEERDRDRRHREGKYAFALRNLEPKL
jgi:hypothetical protein